jgi:hypothetical protein
MPLLRIPTTFSAGGVSIASAGGGGEFSDEFLSIQRVMNTNIDWMKIETVPEEICVVTSVSPHLILKSSNSLSDLFNLPNHELFGQSLRSLFCSLSSLPSTSTGGATGGGTKAGAGAGADPINYFEILDQNKSILEEFYHKLESKPTPPTRGTGERAEGAASRNSSSCHHCVLTLISSPEADTAAASQSPSPSSSPSDVTLIPCVIYAYPIFYHEVVYREYYPGLVSILPESIGTTFSSECYENPSSPPPPPSPASRFGRQGSSPAFLPPNGVLYYQLHFNRIEEQVVPLSPEEEEAFPRANSQNSSIIGNFTRIFSTSSLRSGNGLSRTNTSTTNTSSNPLRSHRYLSSSSGVSTNDRAGSRQGGGRKSAHSQQSTTLSTGSHPSVAPLAEKEQSELRSSEGEREGGGEGLHEELKSEKSLEFDSLEGGLMLERTNTNSSLRSLNSESGWMSKY